MISFVIAVFISILGLERTAGDDALTCVISGRPPILF